MAVFVIRCDICVISTPIISLFAIYNIEIYSLSRKSVKSLLQAAFFRAWTGYGGMGTVFDFLLGFQPGW